MVILPGGALLPNNPRVGYQSILPVSVLSGPGEGLSNLQNPATYLKWTGPEVEPAEPAEILMTPTAPATVNYLGLARHNFGSAGIEYTLETSDDGVEWALAATGAPTNDRVILHEFPEVTANLFRLILSAGTAPASIAILYVGGLLTLERRIQVGHTPIIYGRNQDVSPGLSENGEFLGRVERARWFETGVRMENIDPTIYRQQMDPWLENMTQPFFWAWRPTSWPEEVAFTWFKGKPSMSNQRPNGMVEASFSIQGIE